MVGPMDHPYTILGRRVLMIGIALTVIYLMNHAIALVWMSIDPDGFFSSRHVRDIGLAEFQAATVICFYIIVGMNAVEMARFRRNLGIGRVGPYFAAAAFIFVLIRAAVDAQHSYEWGHGYTSEYYLVYLKNDIYYTSIPLTFVMLSHVFAAYEMNNRLPLDRLMVFILIPVIVGGIYIYRLDNSEDIILVGSKALVYGLMVLFFCLSIWDDSRRFARGGQMVPPMPVQVPPMGPMVMVPMVTEVKEEEKMSGEVIGPGPGDLSIHPPSPVEKEHSNDHKGE